MRKKLERICLDGPVGIFPAPHSRCVAGADRSGDGQICRGGLPPEDSVPVRPDRDGNTHVVLEQVGLPPLYFMAKLRREGRQAIRQ